MGQEIAGCPRLNVEFQGGVFFPDRDARSRRPVTTGAMSCNTGHHRFYAGVDLHARTMFTHVLDSNGNTVFERDVPTHPGPTAFTTPTTTTAAAPEWAGPAGSSRRKTGRAARPATPRPPRPRPGPGRPAAVPTRLTPTSRRATATGPPPRRPGRRRGTPRAARRARPPPRPRGRDYRAGVRLPSAFRNSIPTSRIRPAIPAPRGRPRGPAS